MDTYIYSYTVCINYCLFTKGQLVEEWLRSKRSDHNHSVYHVRLLSHANLTNYGFLYIYRWLHSSVCYTIKLSSINSRVPEERFLRICLNGITHTCMMHRWNEENKPHRNKYVVVMYCGHVFF